jgi:hypothetical protein
MIEILMRLLMSLVFAGLLSGLPALSCLLLVLKVRQARRTGVWIGRWGGRWTRDSDPDRFEMYARISTFQATALGILAVMIAFGILAIFLQPPIKPPPALHIN